LTSALAFDVCVAVVGTSWIRDSTERLLQRWPRASSLMEEVALRGGGSLSRIRSSLEDSSPRAHDVYAFAELTRGAFLGLATHLDLTWPAPIAAVGLDMEA
jgi:hypothetical protein